MNARSARQLLRGHLDALGAADIDKAEQTGRLPGPLLAALAADGLLLPTLPARQGGLGVGQRELGALCEEMGGVWVSLLSVVTAHAMAAQAIGRWGRKGPAAAVLPAAASGTTLLSFAVSEPETGSDTAAVRTRAEPDGDGFQVNGVKTWLSGGAGADLFLVIAGSPRGPVAVLVDRAAPGVEVTAMEPLLGFRSAALARLVMTDVAVPADRVVGRPGTGLTHVAATALDHGRFCLAWGAVGLAQAVLRMSADHTARREQFGAPLARHQLVRALLTDMMVETTAARLLCAQASAYREEGSPLALVHTSMAKYRAARTAAQASRNALQLHGAAGCVPGHPVERAFRDAKLLELVEGTEQIHQMTIAGHIDRFVARPVD